MKLPILDGAERYKSTSVTFTGNGGLGENGTQTPLFSVVGRVLVRWLPIFIDSDLDQSGATANISFGTVNQVVRFTTANPVQSLDTGEWFKTGQAVVGSQDMGATQTDIIVSEDIVADHTGTAHCNSGRLTVDCWYVPLSPGAALN